MAVIMNARLSFALPAHFASCRKPIDRDQIRRPAYLATNQCPGCQGLVMIINDKDVLAADVLVPEQIRQGHSILHPFVIESLGMPFLSVGKDEITSLANGDMSTAARRRIQRRFQRFHTSFLQDGRRHDFHPCTSTHNENLPHSSTRARTSVALGTTESHMPHDNVAALA